MAMALAPIPCCASKTDACQRAPLRYLPSSAVGCMIGVGDKTDAKPRRDTDGGSEETSSHQRSNENTGNNMSTWSAESRARPEKTHAPFKVVLPKWVSARVPTALRHQY